MKEEEKRTSFLVGKGSNGDLSVWEGLSFAGNKLKEKGVAVGSYFLVGQSVNKRKYPGEIAKYDLFVAGHHPYSSSDKFHVTKRGYSRLVTTPLEKLLTANFTQNQIDEIYRLFNKEEPEEYRCCQSNIYYLINEEREFSLIMENGDWLDSKKAIAFMEDMFSRKSLVKFSDPGVFLYKPSVSKGYFLAGFEYVVSAVMVGDHDDTLSGHKKKILCIDLLSGVPGIVPYNLDDLTPIE